MAKVEKSFEYNGGQLDFSIFNFSFYIIEKERERENEERLGAKRRNPIGLKDLTSAELLIT